MPTVLNQLSLSHELNKKDEKGKTKQNKMLSYRRETALQGAL